MAGAALPAHGNYEPAREPSLAHAAELRLVTWNIHGAVGTDRACEPGRIARVLQEIDADVVALQEVPSRGSERGARAHRLNPISGAPWVSMSLGTGIWGVRLTAPPGSHGRNSAPVVKQRDGKSEQAKRADQAEEAEEAN